MRETIYNLTSTKYSGDRPLTLSVLADLHNHPDAEIARSLEQNRPDYIVVPGDLIYGDTRDEERIRSALEETICPFLRRCRRIAPVILSLGNHEWVLSREHLGRIASEGVTVLDNRWILAEDGIAFGGMTSGIVMDIRRALQENGQGFADERDRYPLQYRGQIHLPEDEWLEEFESQQAFRILLCHHPEYWALQQPYLEAHPIDLMIAGHAHGGQIGYRRHGERRGLFAPGQGFFPKYTGGMHQGANGSMIISRGLTNTVRLIPRIGNPTEIVYITITGK
ncbi:MAG: metallophosphoesterase [Mogibacterium sp.]|nr:metallophosphoesterase [Mogibacterium sp.]